MGLCLIPVGNTGKIILPLEQSSMGDSYLLDRHPEILFKQNRIRKMPAVKTSLRKMIVRVVIVMNPRVMA